MSTAERLGLEEESPVFSGFTDFRPETLDLTGEEISLELDVAAAQVSTPDPALLEPVSAEPLSMAAGLFDDPAMRFVYMGTALLLALFVLAAVLTFA